jgi:DNA-binding SARP family transcriptional activator
LEDAGWALPPEVEIQRQALERLYADALRKLIAHTGDQEALPFLERLLVVEPAEEMARRALVLGYLARGRRDLAARQVVRWREVLDELNLEPSEEVRALWRMVEEKRSCQLSFR